MSYYPYIKQQIDTIYYEDTRNCFHSLDFHVRKIDKLLESFVQDFGSDYRWIVYEIQNKLSEIHAQNKRHWFKKGSEELFMEQKRDLITTVELLYAEADKYNELKEWLLKQD